MEIIDNQGIVNSLEEIIENFENEIAPYAEQLTKHLVNIFFKYCNKQCLADDSSEDEESSTELAATSCLEAIQRIIMSPLPDYCQIENNILPVLNFAFTQPENDFVSEALELLNLLLFKNKRHVSE